MYFALWFIAHLKDSNKSLSDEPAKPQDPEEEERELVDAEMADNPYRTMPEAMEQQEYMPELDAD